MRYMRATCHAKIQKTLCKRFKPRGLRATLTNGTVGITARTEEKGYKVGREMWEKLLLCLSGNTVASGQRE